MERERDGERENEREMERERVRERWGGKPVDDHQSNHVL